MPTTPDNQNRRRFHRILFDTAASVKATNKTYQCNIIDISLKGALISQPAHWDEAPGDEVVLEIKLSEDGTQITMQGEVAHVEPGQIGIRCNQIDIDSISHLRRLAELNVGDAELIERELAALS